MFNEILDLLKEAVDLIKSAEALPSAEGEEKKKHVVSGLKKYADKLSFIPEGFKTKSFIEALVEFLVCLANLPGEKSSLKDVAKKAWNLYQACGKGVLES